MSLTYDINPEEQHRIQGRNAKKRGTSFWGLNTLFSQSKLHLLPREAVLQNGQSIVSGVSPAQVLTLALSFGYLCDLEQVPGLHQPSIFVHYFMEGNASCLAILV